MSLKKNIKYTIEAEENVSEAAARIAKVVDKQLNKSLEENVDSYARAEKASQIYSKELEKQGASLDEAHRKMEDFGYEFERVGEKSHNSAKTLGAAVALLGAAFAMEHLPELKAGLQATGATMHATVIHSSELRNAFLAAKESALVFAKGGMTVLNKGMIKLKAQSALLSKGGIKALGKELLVAKDNAMFFFKTFKDASTLVSGASRTFISAAKHTELLEKGLAGTVVRAGLGASAFAALGTSLLASDGIMNKMAGVTLIALALAMGGFVTVVYYALDAVGSLITAIGDGLTNASMKQIEAFSEAEKTTFAFNHTIAAYTSGTEEATKATASWTSFQEELTSSTGTTAASMRALIAETVSATAAAGLNEEQQQQLIRSTLDLSERAHKPAIDTLTAMINAMNGAGQGVVALGLHINDAAVKHSKLSKSQKEVFKTADDATKAQTRFAVLMEQAGKASNFATENANLYSKSLKLQKNALMTLNAELGKGAEIINGQVVYGLAKATDAMTSFFKPILPGVGFLQALGGRVLQVTGFLTKNLLTITLLTSSYKALNVLLAKGFAGGAFGKQLPFINKSIGRMAKELGATTLHLNSVKNVGKATFQILTTQALNGVKALIGLDSAAKLTAGTIGKQMVKGFLNVGKAIMTATKASLTFLATPIGATIVAIAAGAYLLYQAFKKLEEETGIFTEVWADLVAYWNETSPVVEAIKDSLTAVAKVLAKSLAIAVKVTAAALGGMLSIVYKVILGWQELSSLLPGSLGASQQAIDKTRARIAKLDAATAKFAKGALTDMGNLLMSSAEAAEHGAVKLSIWEQNILKATAASAKMGEAAKKAFEFASDFTPRINLANFEKEASKFESQLVKLEQTLQKEAGFRLISPEASEESKAEIERVKTEIAYAEEAIKAIRIKQQIATRDARIKEVQIELTQAKMMAFTVEQEITQMKLNSAKDYRDQLIQLETQRLLTQKEMISAEAQAGLTVKQEALMAANSIELQAFQNKLNAERELALTAEQQKQLALANLRSSLLSGTEGAQGADQSVEVLQEQQKMAQLQALREQKLISEQQYQSDVTALTIAAKQSRMEAEILIEQQRIAMLGLSPEALSAKLALQQQQDQMELESLRTKLQNKQITEQEFKIAGEQLAMSSEARMNQIREQHLQNEIAQNRRRGESWKATLKEVELAQQQHGKVMGTIRAMQGSAEFGAIQGALGNLSSLRNSESKKEFEIGKKAAIAQASIAMFLGATQAFASLSSIPFVGPALGVAAAAAAVMAGMMNIRQIRSQKFGGGSASGSPSAPTAQVPTQSMGGQADEGMDAVPKSLSGKSFILSAGERVVQPEANKKLTAFLDKQEGGGLSGGNTFNITVNGNVDSPARVDELAEAIVVKIREKSERGETVISSRGVA